MLDQAFDSALQRHHRRWAAGTCALHSKVKLAILVTAINDVTAILRHGRPDTRFQQFLDLVDDVRVGWVLLETDRFVRGYIDAGRRSLPEQGSIEHEMIEQ